MLREAIVNALMHASYRIQQPIQIIRYGNRIEIRNPGYSLKNEDMLGEPGSRPRNPKIAAIFHDTNIAETKGSGIRIMRRLMHESGFAPPTFESNRANNEFTARLLLHHFLTPADMEWLSRYDADGLNDAQKRALIFVRESGAIDNAAYRQLNAVDTLSASNDLRKLRDKDLLVKKGKSTATYYTAGSALFVDGDNANTHQLEDNTHQLEDNTHQLEDNTHQLEDNTHQSLPLPLREALENIGKKPRISTTQSLVKELCAIQAFGADELLKLLQRTDKKALVRDILNPMIEQGVLEHTIAESPTSPKQRYRTVDAVRGKPKGHLRGTKE